MLFQTSLGIDIQDHSVSFAYLKASFKGVRLAAHATYPLEEEIPFKEKVEQMGGMINDFLRKNTISPAAFFLGMPRNVAILRYVELPLAVKENLRESIGYELEKYIPFSADEIYFDHQIISEEKEEGKLTVLLIAVRKETVVPYLDLAIRAGIGVSGIEIGSTAMANYFWRQRDSGLADPFAIVYLTDGHLEFNLLKRGFLAYSRSINRGEWGDNLPEFISHSLRKLKEGLGESEGRLSTVFCGLDSDAELVHHFRSDEGLEVHLADLSKRGIPSSVMIPAYGLALRGIRKLPTEINLLPKALRKRPKKAGYYTMVVLAILLILSALAWGGGSIISQRFHLKRLDTEIARLGVKVANIEQAKAKCKKIEDRIEYLSGLYGASIPILDVFKELSVRIPKTAWVRQLTLSDHEVIINGFAESSSELIPSLESSPLFRDVAFLSSITRMRSAGDKEVFRIGLKIEK
ncbi:MAG: pilus assembly protein PilM [Pseudomonadota bacterium]